MPNFITGQTAIAQQAERSPENVALTEARSKVRKIDWEISQAESSMRQLSPPIRTTANGVTTYDRDKQRQFEMNRDRIDQQIENLKEERTIWELRVNQILQTPIVQQAERSPENVALTEARSKVRKIDWEISQAESSMRQLSPPIRTTANGVTTYDRDKQRQFEMNRDRIDQRIESLKEERTMWEVRVNQILLMETMLKRTNNP